MPMPCYRSLLQTESLSQSVDLPLPLNKSWSFCGGATGTRRWCRDMSPRSSLSPSCEVGLGEDFGLNSAFHHFRGLKFDPYSVVGTQIWTTLLILVTCCASEHLPASLLCSENAGIVHLNYNLAVIICLYWFNKTSCLFCFHFNISKKERLTIRNINILDFTYLVAWRRLKRKCNNCKIKYYGDIQSVWTQRMNFSQKALIPEQC